MREDHGMDDETPDWASFTEAEWLETWQAIHARLEQTRAALVDSEVGMTDVQAAMLDGQMRMLRQVLESRGVDLDG